MRTDEQILARILPLRFGGAEKPLRVLGIAEERKWKETLQAVVGGIADLDVDASDMAGAVDTILSAAGDRILDLVLAYDVDSELGGREWIEANATSEEVYIALKSIFEVVAPFVNDARTAMNYVQMLMRAAQSAQANSTNSALQNGVSTRKRSKVA